MTEGFVCGGMQIKLVSWWDRLWKRKCSFCGRRLTGKMLFGGMMERGVWPEQGISEVWSDFSSLYACVDVERCEKTEKDNEHVAEDVAKKKLAQALEESRADTVKSMTDTGQEEKK